MYEKISAVVFSATGNTRKYAEKMLEASSLDSQLFDITEEKEPLKKSFGENELVIIGTPVYGGRIPKVARERLECLKGNKTDLILLACYGNRHYDDALAEMSDLFSEKGFIVKSAGAVVGKHTFGEIQVDRPSESDLEEISAFIKHCLAMPKHEKINVPGNRPYKDGGSGGKFRPTTNMDKCTHCGLCIKKCPVGAINSDMTVSDACLSCFRCISVCPTGAKLIDSPEYDDFAPKFSLRLKEPRENEFFI